MVLIKDEIDPNATGKTDKSLAKSRKLRDDFRNEIGFVPSSILVHDQSDKSIDLISDGSYAKSSQIRGKTGRGKASRDIFDVSGQGCSSGALSKFPQNIGRTLVKFYCPDGGVVYDPFAGHNSRMQLTFESQRNYIGVDVSKRFMSENHKVRKMLLSNAERSFCLLGESPEITLIEGSSSNVDLPDECADFTITSPPYWDIEYYGDEAEQLGNAKTYDGFLKLLYEHITENYRILKPDSFCCWCVNDFRRRGVYFAYHADLIPLFIKAGFDLHTIYIINLGVPIGIAFVQSIIKSKAFPKQHEYCLVFKK